MKNKENKLNRKEVKESMGDKVNGKEASKASEIKYPTDIKKVLDSSKGEDLLIYTPAGLGTYHKILQWIKQNGKTVKVYKSDDEVIDGDILDILLLDSVELIGYVLTVYNHYKKAGKQVIYLPYNTPVDLNLRNKFRTIFLYGASPENGFEKIEEQFNERLKEDMEDKTLKQSIKEALEFLKSIKSLKDFKSAMPSDLKDFDNGVYFTITEGNYDNQFILQVVIPPSNRKSRFTKPYLFAVNADSYEETNSSFLTDIKNVIFDLSKLFYSVKEN